jgi:hypothetical protein
MSFYNMFFGFNPAAIFLLPMLGKQSKEYPRFRDCFASDSSRPEFDGHIHIYTRTGGGNRLDYVKENAMLQANPLYVADYDDSDDNTFASFIFKVPEQWTADYNLIMAGKFSGTSKAYQEMVYKFYPSLHEKLDKYFIKAA